MNVYHATVDTDSYCNGEKIHASSNKELIHSLLVTGFGYDHGSNWKKHETISRIHRYYSGC